MKRITGLLMATGGVLLWMAHAAAAGRGLLWWHSFEGGASDLDRANAVSASGDNAVAAGFIREPDPNTPGEYLEKAHARSYGRDGTLRWALTRGPVSRTEYWASTMDADGNAFLLGAVHPDSGAADSLILTKATPAGDVAWEVVEPQPAGYTGVETNPSPAVVLRDGMLYLMWQGRNHPTDNDAICLLALSRDTGQVPPSWGGIKVLTGPDGYGFDSATGLAAGDDGSGGTALAVTGTAKDATGSRGGIGVFRIDPATGDPVWQTVVGNAGPQSQSRKAALAGGKILIGATLEDPAAPGEYVAGIFAFDLSSGAESWRDNTVGSNPSDTNSMTYLGVSGGALFVAGIRDNGTLDTFVRAYRPDNGNLLWNRDIPGTAFSGGPSFLVFSGTDVSLGGQFPAGATAYAPGIVFLDNATGAVADNVVFTQSASGNDRFNDGAAGSAGIVFVAGRIVDPAPPDTKDDFLVAAAGPLPPAQSGGGGGWCSATPVPRASPPPFWEWGVPLAPALFLALRRRIRKAFSCNKGVIP